MQRSGHYFAHTWTCSPGSQVRNLGGLPSPSSSCAPQPSPKWISPLYPAPVQAQILSSPAGFLSCSSQEWPLPPQCPCAGLTGASPFSHFFSLIRLKSGSKLPWQMRQSELDQGTSKARLRHQRLWRQCRFWLLSQGRGLEGVSAVCALSAWNQHMG